MMEHRIFTRNSLTIDPLSVKGRYANLSNLTLVARSSRSTIGKALESGFDTIQVETSSYLIVSLCFKEYCHASSLAIDLLGIEAFETIACYYNRLANEHQDRQLLMFSGAEVEIILERVGACIRSISCGTEE
jgi:hypothetical protein